MYNDVIDHTQEYNFLYKPGDLYAAPSYVGMLCVYTGVCACMHIIMCMYVNMCVCVCMHE